MGTENYNSFVYDTPDNKQEETSSQFTQIIIGVFFDGTQNNKYNVAARSAKSGEAAEAFKKYDSDETSYENDPSNVERLWNLYLKVNAQYKIYIEGAGTSSSEGEDGKIYYGKDDSIDGTGFGNHENGIRGKVRKACEKAAKILKNKDDLAQITFDVFGFSRGAATARNFVHEVKRSDGIQDLCKANKVDSQEYLKKGVPKYGLLGYFLKENGFQINEIADLLIQIRFVGLFETVSSYSPTKTLDPNFSNDVGELFLNNVNIFAKKMLQLTANDEHRRNFALTHISVVPDKHIELTLPGVHSDIGGSYMDDKDENVRIDFIETKKLQFDFSDSLHLLEKERQKIISQGWYNTGDALSAKSFSGVGCMLNGNRKRLSHKYSYIPLLIMHRFANEFQNDLFKSSVDSKYMISKPTKTQDAALRNILQQRFNQRLSNWSFEDYQYETKGNSKYSHPREQRKHDLIAEIHADLSTFSDVNYKEICPQENEVLWYTKQLLDKYAFEKQPGFDFLSAKDIPGVCGFKDTAGNLSYADYAEKAIQEKIPALIDVMSRQIYLRVLRNRFLHWSARYGGIANPHQPNPNRVRTHYN